MARHADIQSISLTHRGTEIKCRISGGTNLTISKDQTCYMNAIDSFRCQKNRGRHHGSASMRKEQQHARTDEPFPNLRCKNVLWSLQAELCTRISCVSAVSKKPQEPSGSILLSPAVQANELASMGMFCEFCDQDRVSNFKWISFKIRTFGISENALMAHFLLRRTKGSQKAQRSRWRLP